MNLKPASMSILLVDDEIELIEELSALLSYIPAKVASFTVPLEALEFARVSVFDILLTDFHMQEIDGLALATAISALHPSASVIIMSGAVLDTRAWPPPWRFLKKPFDFPTLLHHITDLRAQ